MWLAGVGAMWIWHAPFLCNAVIQSPALRWFQYATLVAMGTIFWWPIAGPKREWRLPPLVGILYLFTACLGCTALGIVVTFAPPDLYGKYFHAAAAPGIFREWITTPAADQQLGGLLMWVPACFIYITGILGLLNRWYAEPEMGNAVAAATGH
jgi:cytochrome c oxidase assembly factor CtaG